MDKIKIKFFTCKNRSTNESVRIIIHSIRDKIELFEISDEEKDEPVFEFEAGIRICGIDSICFFKNGLTLLMMNKRYDVENVLNILGISQI